MGLLGLLRTLKPPPETRAADSSSQENENSSEAQSALNASSERCARVWLAPAGGREVQAPTEQLGPNTRRSSDAWICLDDECFLLGPKTALCLIKEQF